MYAILLERKEPKNLHIAKIMETPDTLQHAFTCKSTRNLQTPYKFAIATIHTYTHKHSRASRSRTRKGLPPFHTDPITHRSSPEKKCNPKLVSASKNERPPGRTPCVYAPSPPPPSSIFHSRDADRLAEQPQEQRPLEHEDGVQVRPVQREPEHRDPGPVVLQVRHCNASEDGPGRQQQF